VLWPSRVVQRAYNAYPNCPNETLITANLEQKTPQILRPPRIIQPEQDQDSSIVSITVRLPREALCKRHPSVEKPTLVYLFPVLILFAC
jgi:hypothetical protein